MAVDWIIPLGTGSKSNNDELRLLLRSLERHARNLGRVVVVGDALPDWLTSVEVVKRGDPCPANKDANIIDKVAQAVRDLGINQFVFSADDNLLLRDCDCEDIPVLRTNRTQGCFAPNAKLKEVKGKDGKSTPAAEVDWNRWRERVYHTFWLAEEWGVPMRNDYEAHAPQLYRDAALILDGLKTVRYHSGVGYSICSLFRLIEGRAAGKPVEAQAHPFFKATWEDAGLLAPPAPTQVFGGYNDDAFLAGLKGWLFAIYPQASRYEADGGGETQCNQ